MSSFFDPADFSLTRDDDGTLRLHRDGQSVRLAAPRRAMPLSQPEVFIALMSEGGDELGWVRDLAEIEENSRKLLDEALQKAYRIERIVRILKVEKEALTGQTRWLVEIAAEKNANLEDDDDAPEATDSNGAQRNGAASKNGSATLNGAGQNDKAARGGKIASDGAAPRKSAGDDSASTREPKLLRVFSEKDDDAPGVIERLKRKRRAASADDETLFGGLNVSESEERQFSIGGQEDVQTARYPHIFIVDTDRNRYEVLDCEALDLESRRAAERFF